MSNPNDVEKFLINKYGVSILAYKGFKYIRDIICSNDDYIIGKTVQELQLVADNYNVPWKSVERAIRYMKDTLGHTKDPITVFINNLIFEFKEYRNNHNKKVNND